MQTTQKIGAGRISSRSPLVAEYIAERTTFSTHGALRATTDPTWGGGSLRGADEDRWVETGGYRAEYVVLSYDTPIAWWSEMYGWHVVSQKFSVTTSRHQSRLYKIKDGAS